MNAAASNPLEIHGLVKRYPDFTLSLDELIVPRGYVMGLVGANGSGKTTTIKAALGLIHPDAGSVRLIDKGRIGVVWDTPALLANWRRSDVSRALAPFYPLWNQSRFDEIVDAAGIGPRVRVRELSRGMGMKMQVAVALSHGAELLILDEPTSGLDPYARDEFVSLLADFMTDEAHSVLFSTHITSDLDKIADYVTVLHAGRVIASTTKDDLMDSYRLVRGAASALTDDLRTLVLGLREHSAGWEGLLPTEETIALPRGVTTDAPTLDDIIVHVSRTTRREEPYHV